MRNLLISEDIYGCLLQQDKEQQGNSSGAVLAHLTDKPAFICEGPDGYKPAQGS